LLVVLVSVVAVAFKAILVYVILGRVMALREDEPFPLEAR
jgi:hypothetical protein